MLSFLLFKFDVLLLYRETYGKRLGPLGKKFWILRKKVKFWLFSQNDPPPRKTNQTKAVSSLFVSSSGPNLLPKKNTEMFMFSESLKPASRLKSLKLSVVGSRLMMLLISLVSVQWNKLPTWPESFHICICILEHFSVLPLLTLCACVSV